MFDLSPGSHSGGQSIGEIIQACSEIVNDLANGHAQFRQWLQDAEMNVIGLPIRLRFEGCEIGIYLRQLSPWQEWLEIRDVLTCPFEALSDSLSSDTLSIATYERAIAKPNLVLLHRQPFLRAISNIGV